jgi:lipoate-protein ligase A
METMNTEMMNQIMEDPQKREQMMSMMKEHVADMDELLSSNLSDQEFSEKMLQLMNQHMSEMRGLMQMP